MSAPTRTDLDALAAAANAEHHAFETTQTAALAHAMAAGEALTKAKKLVGHGGWLRWVAEHCEFTGRTAQRYMVLAANASRVSDLGTVREALATLADASAPGVYEPRPPDPHGRRERETRVVPPELEPYGPMGNGKGPHPSYADCWIRVPWVDKCPGCGLDLYAPRAPDDDDGAA